VDDVKPEDPLPLGVEQVMGFWKVFNYTSSGVMPSDLTGRYTTEAEAVLAVAKYYMPAKEHPFHKNGRPKFKPRDGRGRKANKKVGPYKNWYNPWLKRNK
jgi:hypothetical protein